MENNISSLISNQFPEYLRESSPIFSEFLVTYYEYASQRNKSIGLIQNNSLDIDIDLTEEVYISKFLSTYGEYLPKSAAIDNRNFIKLLNNIYESKGTEKSLKLVFKLLFGDNINIFYPKENVLRGSDGKWNQENFITVNTIFGLVSDGGFSISAKNSFGEFEIVISRIIRVSNTQIRMYYKSYDAITFINNQPVFIYSDDGATIYAGIVIPSPSRLIIRYGGKGWQIGKVISIGNDHDPMIIRVSSVDSYGSITSIKILNHGFLSPASRLFQVSPYPNKPNSNSLTMSSTLMESGGYHHSIMIEEKTNGISESILGFSNNKQENLYFLEDYVEFGYDGYISIAETNVPENETFVGDDLSIEDWYDSAAVFYYETDLIVKTNGYYLDESGTLSNQEIRLQDNYYYQDFSYVIETARDISEYNKILEITHPAGTKRFSKLIKKYNGVLSDIKLTHIKYD